MKKQYLFLFIALIGFLRSTQAQNKLILVEHFTNTLCSNCSSRNPAFYQNIQSQNGLLHISFHPSSPYPACILNKHNKTENDGRTNYYGIYGSTPRLVINGLVQSNGADYSSAAIFTPFQNKIAEIGIKINQTEIGDSLISTVVIKNISASNITDAKLFVAYVEDTIFYKGPNGEALHYNVFRKSATAIDGNTISIPNNTSDSLVINVSTLKNNEWTKNRIYTMAWVQKSTDKSVINAAKSDIKSNSTTGINNIEAIENSIYPNPVIDRLNIHLSYNVVTQLLITNLLGEEILNKEIESSESIDVSAFKAGIYFAKLKNANGESIHKFVK